MTVTSPRPKTTKQSRGGIVTNEPEFSQSSCCCLLHVFMCDRLSRACANPSCVWSGPAQRLGVLLEMQLLYQRLALSSGFFWNNIYLVLIFFFFLIKLRNKAPAYGSFPETDTWDKAPWSSLECMASSSVPASPAQL